MTTNRHSNYPEDNSEPLEPMSLAEFDSRVGEYVAGKLRDPEQARFEETLLANPEWADRVAAARMLREGIREVARSEPGLFGSVHKPT